MITPFYMAFPELEDFKADVFQDILTGFFSLDIVINFLTAYYDENLVIVDRYKDIAVNYLFGWFFIDFITVIPFDVIFQFGQISRMARFARIGKIQRLFKVFKLASL